MGILPSLQILDVGCGKGCAAACIHPHAGELCLLDISEEAITEVRERFSRFNNIKACNLDISRISGTFDLIYYFLSFHHIDTPKAQLTCARSLLGENGNLVICEFYSPEGNKFHIHDKVFKDAYTPDDLRTLLIDSEFKINEQKEIGVFWHNGTLFSVYILQASVH